MNIKDVVETGSPLLKEGDALSEIFSQQQKLMEQYDLIERRKGVDAHFPVNLHTCRGQQRVKDLLWRVVEELGEAGLCLKNRPWKQTEVPVDIDHYYEELSDALHFFIEVCIASGLDAQALVDLYFKKSKVNEFRQRSQY